MGYAMFAHVKFESALVGLVCIAVGCMNGKASAVTADVARKCAALTAKAYRPQVPGNPAAGLAKGTVGSQAAFLPNQTGEELDWQLNNRWALIIY